MSILLDALKKSEEQRRIGQAPNIHSAAAETPGGGDAAPRWIPVAMVAASVVLMAGIGWLQLRAPVDLGSMTEPQLAAQETAGEEDKSPADEKKSGAKQGQAPSMAAGPSRSRRTPVETFSGRDKPTPGTPSEPETSASNPRTQVNENFRTFKSEPSRSTASTSTASSSQPTPAASEPSVSRAVASEGPVDASVESGADVQKEPAALEPISYWQLPQSIRDDMPDLRITVLVFADKPEDRFLLVNGQRLVEKDEIPGGVVLDEIRRDGAVFQYRKYRFLVKG